MKKYKHSLANYPQRYIGLVVSPHKICLQFEEVVVKTRIAYHDTSDLLELRGMNPSMPIPTTGAEIHILAIGTPIQEIIELQRSLISAYKEYYNTHKDYFFKHYEKDFKEELLALREQLDNVLKDM